MENIDLKVGDKVRVVNNSEGLSLKSGIGIIKEIEGGYNKLYSVYFKDINGEYWFFKEQIELLKKPTIDELEKMPMGTRITTDRKRDNVFVKTESDNLEFYSIERGNNLDSNDIEEDLSINYSDCGTKIIKIEKPTQYETIYDCSDEIQEMTVAEIEKTLGHPVKIIKEEE